MTERRERTGGAGHVPRGSGAGAVGAGALGGGGADGLDDDRIARYTLAQRLSLTAGPLRLLNGAFPDREFMAGIAEHNR